MVLFQAFLFSHFTCYLEKSVYFLNHQVQIRVSMRKIAVITGVSKGIGQALAREFQWQGYHVIGVSRTKPAQGVDEWIEADLASSTGVMTCALKIKQRYHSISVLVNNVGRGHYETWEDSGLVDIRGMFELNFFSMVNMTKRLLPLLKKSEGTVVNISSVASHLPISCMGAYCATKAAVNMFSDSLRMELRRDQVCVLNVEVGRVSTGFSEGCTGDREVPSSPGAAGSPAKLVAKVVEAVKQRKERLVFPRWYKCLYVLSRLFPKYYEKKNLEKWKLN
jgi:short-subunit dehydrogenase